MDPKDQFDSRLNEDFHQRAASRVEMAGFWLRFFALIWDGVFIFILAIAASAIAVSFFGAEVLSTEFDTSLLDGKHSLSTAQWLMNFLPIFLAILYGGLLEGSVAQATLGKLLLGLRVADTHSSPALVTTTITRNVFKYMGNITFLCAVPLLLRAAPSLGVTTTLTLMGLLVLSVCLYPIIDGLFAAFTIRKRALHDSWSGTIVIKNPAVGDARRFVFAIMALFIPLVLGVVAVVTVTAFLDKAASFKKPTITKKGTRYFPAKGGKTDGQIITGEGQVETGSNDLPALRQEVVSGKVSVVKKSMTISGAFAKISSDSNSILVMFFEKPLSVKLRKTFNQMPFDSALKDSRAIFTVAFNYKTSFSGCSEKELVRHSYRFNSKKLGLGKSKKFHEIHRDPLSVYQGEKVRIKCTLQRGGWLEAFFDGSSAILVKGAKRLGFKWHAKIATEIQ